MVGEAGARRQHLDGHDGGRRDARVAVVALPIDDHVGTEDRPSSGAFAHPHAEIALVDVEDAGIHLRVEGREHGLSDALVVARRAGLNHDLALHEFAPLVARFRPGQELASDRGEDREVGSIAPG